MSERDNKKNKLADYFVVALKMLEIEKEERVLVSKLVKSLRFSEKKVKGSLEILEELQYIKTVLESEEELCCFTEEGRRRVIKMKEVYVQEV